MSILHVVIWLTFIPFATALYTHPSAFLCILFSPHFQYPSLLHCLLILFDVACLFSLILHSLTHPPLHLFSPLFPFLLDTKHILFHIHIHTFLPFSYKFTSKICSTRSHYATLFVSYAMQVLFHIYIHTIPPILIQVHLLDLFHAFTICDSLYVTFILIHIISPLVHI